MSFFKSIKLYLLGMIAVLGGLCFPLMSQAATDISLVTPTERAIYQRDNSNVAGVKVEANYDGQGRLEARITKGEEALCEWSPLVKREENSSQYRTILPDIPAGGWYQLTLRAVDEISGEELARKTVEKVGVGDVFITGGQSNSCNFGGAKTVAKEDIVSAYNVKTKQWQHCEDSQPSNSGFNTGNEGGSAWPSMGDALVAKTGVPVGFISTGVGSAKIEELRTKHYFAIRDAINALAHYGCRAFLLHQGEADTNETNRDAYLASLKKLIAQTREDACYDLNWMIAQVSYAWSNYNNTEKMESMKATQRAACNNYNIFVGPTTDDLQGDYRRKQDNLHLSEKGLMEHGKRWADEVYAKMMQTYNVFVAEGVEHGSIVIDKQEHYAGDLVNVTLQPEEGYYFKVGSLKANEENVSSDGTGFRMRASNTYVSAEFVTREELVNSLNATIAQAEVMPLEVYEEESKAAFTTAVEQAKQVVANAESTAEQLQQAALKIEEAKDGLVLKLLPTPTPAPTKTPKPTASPTPVPTETPSPTASPVASPTATPAQTPLASPTASPSFGTAKPGVTSSNKLRTMKLSKVKCAKTKVSGQVSVKGTSVKVKIAKKTYKAKVSGKKFTAKVKKMKKKTKVKITVTKKGYKTITKSYKAK